MHLRRVRLELGLLCRERCAESLHGSCVVFARDLKVPAQLQKFLLQIEAVILELEFFFTFWRAPSFQALLDCFAESLIQHALLGTGVDRAPDKCCEVQARVGVLHNVALLIVVRATSRRQVALQQSSEQFIEHVPELADGFVGPAALQAEPRPCSQIVFAPLFHVGVEKGRLQAHKVRSRNQANLRFVATQTQCDQVKRYLA